MPNVFGKTNKPCRSLVVTANCVWRVVVTVVHILEESVLKNRTDIRSLSGENFNGGTPLQRLNGRMIHDVNDVVKSQ